MRFSLGMVVLMGVLSTSSVPALARGPHCIVPDLGLPLAGPGVVDCGVAEIRNSRQINRLLKCARKALAKDKPVRFGVGYLGIDSFGCDVVVVDDSRTFWQVTFDWDLSFPDAAAEAFVGRCAVTDLDWEISQDGIQIAPNDCVFDEEAFKRARIRHP